MVVSTRSRCVVLLLLFPPAEVVHPKPQAHKPKLRPLMRARLSLDSDSRQRESLTIGPLDGTTPGHGRAGTTPQRLGKGFLKV